MEYHLHPLIVHFPIALLFLYSIIKIIPLSTWLQKVSWKPIERFLLLVGTIGIFFATWSGETAKDITTASKNIIEMHEVFANLTSWFYVLLVVCEFLPMVIRYVDSKNLATHKVLLPFKKISLLLKHKWLVILLSVLGLVSLLVTGLLGGVMVYGTTADPLAPLVLSILGL